ncbi:hypothetical protein C0992_006905, partial [Termitomyces sp. T32_za158]
MWLWTELSPDSKVAAYIEPLVQMDLACQERMWVEAATQSAAVMSAEQEAELLQEQRAVLAEHTAKRMAKAQAAGFLVVEPVSAKTGSEVVGTEEAVLQEAGVDEPEAAEELTVPAGDAVAAEESVVESEAQDNEEEVDDKDEAPVMPKKVPTIGSSGPLPAVFKRASKSTTPSKQRLQKVVPQYE